MHFAMVDNTHVSMIHGISVQCIMHMCTLAQVLPRVCGAPTNASLRMSILSLLICINHSGVTVVVHRNGVCIHTDSNDV